MSEQKNICTTISSLLRAGKTPKEIVRDLGYPRATVYGIKTCIDAGKDPQPSPCKQKWPTLSPRVVAGLKKRIRSAPTKSLRKVAAEAQVPRKLVRQVVKEAGWRSLRRGKVPLISAQRREKRVQRSKILLNKLKEGNRPGRIIFYSDEKNFVVDPTYNAQNERWIQFSD